MKKKLKLSSSMEDYLAAIARLKERHGVARVRDMGCFLHVKSSSVNSALQFLSKKGLVDHEKYGLIDLTPEGEQAARIIQKKYDVLLKFFTKILNINEETAMQDACKIEHAISHQTFSKLSKFITYLEVELDKGKLELPRKKINKNIGIINGKNDK